MVEREGNPDLLETVCCICDDGGNLIYCDGRCLRSFHLSNGATLCPSVGLSEAEVEHMDKFFCPNCTLNIHQCFACGQLGRSNGDAQEVNDYTSDVFIALVECIRTGRLDFSCPRHYCRKCGGTEVTDTWDLQFGRAWDNLLSKRVLVYCKRHPIIRELGTPARNHVKFPGGIKQTSVENVVKSEALSKEQINAVTKQFPAALKPSSQNNVINSKVEIGEKGSKLTKLISLKKRDRFSLENASLAGQKTAKLLNT
ncbi:hypothetical protein L7F22_060320 [Adiantum nelumboides]|nr:hypothetical protein [Adiantum nelumboides]